ncbi:MULTISPECIES: TIGR02450 family Trp-rich protein [unclassified Methylophaga]|uniref:TIGR02450 family Trp-rich protein n=1 Tax=unclassified Methylophaga TaxID=2629249 RepID=UPI00267CC83A|tara:strand:- start:702 stop:959 length:258 start_codon:yes stop_codon:yes gene_type:complete
MLILNSILFSSGLTVNRINPAKLHHSKWTAVNPIKREKHFLVSDIEFDEDGSVTSCKLEAIISKQLYSIDWTELKNQEKWIQGWK